MAGWLWLSGTVCVITVWTMPSIGGWLSVLLVLAILWQWRKNRKPERIVLTVEDGWLLVNSQTLAARAKLDDVQSLELETRSIERAYADKMVGTVVVSTSVRPAVDVSRIVLVHDRGDATERVVLGTDYEPHSQVIESLSKLRVFLRRHGWLPADERGEDDEDDAPVESEA